jgi:hypothetical protein
VIILSARVFRLLGALALAATVCGCARPSTAIEVHRRFESAGLPNVDVRLLIQPEHGRMQARYAAGAVAALKQNGEWHPAFERPTLTIVDPPWHGPAAANGPDVVVLDRTPWWSAETSMTPEMAVARALSRHAWGEATAGDDLPAWFVRGLAEYSARRAVVPLFESENLPPGYAFLEQRFFGGFVPRFVRVRLLEPIDGELLPAYRAAPTVSPRVPPSSGSDAGSLEGKTVLALGTLERWVGRPVFDQMLTQFVRESRVQRLTLTDFARVAGAVSGQDLGWFFDSAFGSPGVYDYGVERLVSERDASGAFATTVIARRFGDATFTGSSAARVGQFEAGRGVTLLVTFADGQRRSASWDGRERTKTFQFRSPARAVSAAIDPDRTLLLDVAQTNNSVTLSPRAGIAATVWAARYMFWIENLLLTYSSLT